MRSALVVEAEVKYTLSYFRVHQDLSERGKALSLVYRIYKKGIALVHRPCYYHVTKLYIQFRICQVKYRRGPMICLKYVLNLLRLDQGCQKKSELTLQVGCQKRPKR